MSKILFKKVKNLNLPQGQYALFGSSALGVRDIRECQDIDLIVKPGLYKKLKQDPRFSIKKIETVNVSKEYLNHEEIDVFEEWKPGIWNIDYLIDDSEIINDLPIVKLSEVIKWKKKKNRDKDKKDLELINKYLDKKGLENNF